jgi:hypothetical protein
VYQCQWQSDLCGTFASGACTSLSLHNPSSWSSACIMPFIVTYDLRKGILWCLAEEARLWLTNRPVPGSSCKWPQCHTCFSHQSLFWLTGNIHMCVKLDDHLSSHTDIVWRHVLLSEGTIWTGSAPMYWEVLFNVGQNLFFTSTIGLVFWTYSTHTYTT